MRDRGDKIIFLEEKGVEVKRQVSAGGVLIRKKNGGVEVALIRHSTLRGERVWSLPKGVVEEGETPETAACREVREETGYQGRSLDRIGEISYWFYSKEDQARIFKTVHFFLLDLLSGEAGDHDSEVEEVTWFSLGEAEEIISYRSEKEIVRKASQMVEKKGS